LIAFITGAVFAHDGRDVSHALQIPFFRGAHSMETLDHPSRQWGLSLIALTVAIHATAVANDSVEERRLTMKIIVIAFTLLATVTTGNAHGTSGKVCHQHGSQPVHCHSNP
jgi:hypothetical protein